MEIALVSVSGFQPLIDANLSRDPVVTWRNETFGPEAPYDYDGFYM